jgi:hypothetical protein
MGNIYAGLGGDGSIVYLKKTEGNWIIKEVIST